MLVAIHLQLNFTQPHTTFLQVKKGGATIGEKKSNFLFSCLAATSKRLLSNSPVRVNVWLQPGEKHQHLQVQ